MFPMHGGFMGRKKGGPITSGLLTLEFDDILNAPVADPTDVADWNALLTSTTPFSSVAVTGDIVELFGGGGVDLGIVFGTGGAANLTWLIRIIDTDCVTNIPGNGFRRQVELLEAVFPIITTTGTNLYTFCSKVERIIMPELLEISNSYCNFCSALNEIDFTSAQTMSGTSQFAICASLVNTNFPALTNIGNQAFESCTLLESVSAALVTSIGSSAFNLTPRLNVVNYPVCVSIEFNSFRLAVATTDLSVINLPSCTNVNGAAAFARRNGLTSINLGACTVLGATTGNNNIFLGISGNTITFTLPVGTRTDGDAVALASANTVTFLP